MTEDQEKREIVERVINRIYREYYRHADGHEVQETLNAANHFKLREVIEQYIKYLRNTAKEYRDEASVWCWHDTAKNLDTIASDLESMLKGRWGRVSEWIAWVLMAGGLYFVVIGLANVNKRQPFALVMVLCGVLLAFAANVVTELVSK